MEKTESDAAILAWRRAFAAFSKREPEAVFVYEDGWFVWKTPSGYAVSRVKLSVLANITKNLLELSKRNVTDGSLSKTISMSNRSKNKTTRYLHMPVFSRRKAPG